MKIITHILLAASLLAAPLGLRAQSPTLLGNTTVAADRTLTVASEAVLQIGTNGRFKIYDPAFDNNFVLGADDGAFTVFNDDASEGAIHTLLPDHRATWNWRELTDNREIIVPDRTGRIMLDDGGPLSLGGSLTATSGRLQLYDLPADEYNEVRVEDGYVIFDNAGAGRFSLGRPYAWEFLIEAQHITGNRLVLAPDASGTLALTTDISAANLTGNLTVAQGGTGQTTLPAGALLTGNATGPLTSIAPGTSGHVLTSNGTAWLAAAPSGGGGNITINTTAPLTINGGSTANTSNATLAISAATTTTSGTVPGLGGTTLNNAATLRQLYRVLTVDMGAATPILTGSGSSGISANFALQNSIDQSTGATAGSTSQRITSFMGNTGAAVAIPGPLRFAFRGQYAASTANGIVRVYCGGNQAISSLAAAGFGFELRNARLWIVAHDGTTFSSLDTGVNLGFPAFLEASLSGGVVTVTSFDWSNGAITNLGTLGGGPTVGTPFTGVICVGLTNGADAAAHRMFYGRSFSLFY